MKWSFSEASTSNPRRGIRLDRADVARVDAGAQLSQAMLFERQLHAEANGVASIAFAPSLPVADHRHQVRDIVSPLDRTDLDVPNVPLAVGRADGVKKPAVVAAPALAQMFDGVGVADVPGLQKARDFRIREPGKIGIGEIRLLKGAQVDPSTAPQPPSWQGIHRDEPTIGKGDDRDRLGHRDRRQRRTFGKGDQILVEGDAGQDRRGDAAAWRAG